MVFTIEEQNQSQEAELLASSSSKRENLQNSPPSPSRASSLVKIWEARLNRSNGMNNNLNLESTSSRTCSRLCSSNEIVSSDAGESESVRVADIIKRHSDYNDHEMWHSLVSNQAERKEQRGVAQIISSPKIRGRQAFADLLMQLERDRHRELHSLLERQSVSRFTQRGRIQSMLRPRFLQSQSCGSPVTPLCSAIRQHMENEIAGKKHEHEGNVNDQQYSFLDSQGTADWDDEDDLSEEEEANDWISEISRPRRYWEDRRQARYLEMKISSSSRKEEICKLIERRRVSTFLSSNFREILNQLMTSHMQTQADLYQKEGKHSRISQYSLHMPSPSCYQESQQEAASESRKPLSIEMQLIYELRTKMEQLSCEMSKLRKSVQSSITLQ